jgi:hypothetical protein
LTNSRPEIGLDTGWLYRHSLAGTPGDWNDISDIGNLMIRAETERIMFKEKPPSDPQNKPNLPVGGELFTANKLALLSPYLALTALIGIISACLVKRRRTC